MPSSVGAHPWVLCVSVLALSLCVLSCSVHLPQHSGVYHTPGESAARKRNLQQGGGNDDEGLPRGRRLEPLPRHPRAARRLSSAEQSIADASDVHPPPSIPPCPATSAALVLANRQPLIDLGKGLNIKAWNASAVETACQTWRGVCCNQYGQVQGISTATLGAAGTVPESITQLNSVTDLRLEQAQLNQTIPAFIGAMTQLQLLSFQETTSETKFFQDLVWIETLTSLQTLTFAGTGLKGFVPDQLLSLKGLVNFDVSRTTLDVFPCWLSQFRLLERLEAHEANIYGTIPLELAYMPSLTHLDLGVNQLFGDLHAPLFNLTNLRFFDVSNNFIESPIPPEIGQLVNLTALDLRNNSLTGSIPASISNMTSLIHMQLSENFFELPLPALKGMVSLKVLNLSQNSFSGDLPLADLASATSLEYVSLSDNNITGDTPPAYVAPTIPNLFPNIKGFWFNNMKNRGNIDIFANTPTLRFLGLSRNLFNGSFPASFSKLTNLVDLDISHNNITGPFPAFLLNIPTLKVIDITYNGFSGPLPPGALSKWSSPELHLSHNSFSGDLPPEIANLTGLEVFDVSFNSFTGPADLQGVLSGMQKARQILLNNNKFSGPWPSLENHKALQTLNLANNSFSGSIPDSWGNLVALTSLYVSSNAGFLGSSIPIGIGILTNLQALYSDANQLTGSIPDVFNSLRSLRLVSFANNQLDGPVPSSLCLLDSLRLVNLGNNSLSGAIPSCLYLKPEMQVLDLSGNFLSGTLANEYVTFDAEENGVLQLSNNYLYGLPPTFFNTTDNVCDSNGDEGIQIISTKLISFPGVPVVYQRGSSLADNCFTVPDSTPCEVKELLGQGRSSAECLSFCSTSDGQQCGGYGQCTQDISTGGTPSAADFQCNCVEGFQETSGGGGSSTCQVSSNALSAGAIAGIVIGCVLFVAAIILLWLYVEYRRRRRANQRWRNLDVCTQFTLARVQKATNNWSADSIIGEGSYGTVYKGIPGSTQSSGAHEEWAVKRAKLMTNEFESEVRAMASLHHKNLVRLIGFCADYNSSTGVQEQILIYEFCINGDLGLHLYDRRKIAPLTLDTRLHIAIGAAEGIAYLHSFDPPVIHRDIKPENILLNDVFDAKVADFGLAKKMESVAQATKVAGTPGYVDPEYNRTKVVSTKTDVYSFGIVLLEMITGRHPMVRVSKDENEPLVHIVQWVRPRFEDWDGESLADPVLLAPSEAILELALLAIDCVRCPAMARPEMRDVASRLQGIRAKYGGQLNDVVFVKEFGTAGSGDPGSNNGSGHVGPVRVGSAGHVSGSGHAGSTGPPGSQTNGLGTSAVAEENENMYYGPAQEAMFHGSFQGPGTQQGMVPGIALGVMPGSTGAEQGGLLIEHYDSVGHSAMEQQTHDPEGGFLAQRFDSDHAAVRSQMEDNSQHGVNNV